MGQAMSIQLILFNMHLTYVDVIATHCVYVH